MGCLSASRDVAGHPRLVARLHHDISDLDQVACTLQRDHRSLRPLGSKRMQAQLSARKGIGWNHPRNL